MVTVRKGRDTVGRGLFRVTAPLLWVIIRVWVCKGRAREKGKSFTIIVE